MTLNIPLLDAGTTGYKGQAFLLERGITRCYDCKPPLNNQKVFFFININLFLLKKGLSSMYDKNSS